jgi:hypothetical protein
MCCAHGCLMCFVCRVRRTRQLNDAGVEAIVSGTFETLTYLDVSQCVGITEDALGWIGGALGTTAGRNCRELLTLKACHCDGLRDRGLQWLGKGCRALRFLDLSSCSQVRAGVLRAT